MNLLLEQKDNIIKPYELLSLNNPDLFDLFIKKYNVYCFDIDEGVLMNVDLAQKCSYKILLNPNNNYLIIINENLTVIAEHDYFPRKYIHEQYPLWHIKNNYGKWSCHNIIDILNRCDLCYDFYFKINSENTCGPCHEWLANGRKLSERVKKIIGKKILLLPITNNSEIEYPMLIYTDSSLIHDVNIALADKYIDWWLPLDISEYMGSIIHIIIENLPENHTGLESIYTTDEYVNSSYDELLRPQLRFSQKYGWNNDPNGLVYFKNQYHLFYQTNPFGFYMGEMHWGHAISEDLIHWKELPIALHPHRTAVGNCFSGSANVDYDNETMILVFTDTDKGECVMTSHDGINWVPRENPIIRHNGRDPKLIKYDSGWTIIVYEMLPEENGFAFYKSSDLSKWGKTGFIGGFTDCPEMIELCVDNDPDNKLWVLFGANNEYLIGIFDGNTFVPRSNHKQKAHHGPFQASQCFNCEPNNKIIQIGWVAIDMQFGCFNQTFSLPLELSLKSEKDKIFLCANPINLLNTLRLGSKSILNKKINADKRMRVSISGNLFDIIIRAQVSCNKLEIKFGQNSVKYDNINKTIDNIPLISNKDNLFLRIIIDKPMYEFFVNDGEIYKVNKRLDGGEKIEFIEIITSEGDAVLNELTIYDMASIWKYNIF